MQMALPDGDGLPAEVRLLPAGTTASTKGKYTFDAESAKAVLAAADDYGNDYFFDYGHASLDRNAQDPGRAGRAAGTFRLTVRDGELWTLGLRWTDEARQYLADRQYRYISPAFRHVDGHVREFVNAALTNMPATKGMTPIVMSRDAGDADADDNTKNSPNPEKPMRLVLTALGLSDNASEAEALDAVTRLRGKAKDLAALTDKADVDEALGVIRGWKEQAAKLPDVAAKLEKLEAAQRDAEVQSMVDTAVTSGLLPPAMKDEALSIGRENPKFLKGFLSTFRPLVSTKPEGEKPPSDKDLPVPAELQAGFAEVVKHLPGMDAKKLAELAAKGPIPTHFSEG